MQWFFLPWRRDQQEDTGPAIDMGSGHFLTAADLLEGHYHRLATQTVAVQVKPDLQAAITLVAPELAPLTAVASEVAQAMPRVQPAAHFRADLHRALELTHRQQHAQRVLGTRPLEKERELPWGIMVLVALLVFVSGLLLYRQLYHQRNRTVSNRH
ncbi:MAG: hypothetical protein DCC57_14070 [Chloroflexi bacterium]|nr:MAG: hypothetical protein DCC57_14070 [Chloroflexota bacterium]